MDFSDPQTLGFMVFGGFVVLSAVGIALVSTLSMKEMSYEEALAKQRREIVQNQRSEKKKKKDRTLEKKNKVKRKEEQSDGTEPESDSEPAVEPDAVPEPKATPDSEPVESLPAPSPKDKKKKSARVEPAPVVESAGKKVLAVAPVGDVHMVPEVTKQPSAAKTESTETSNKKKKSKNKPEPVSVTDFSVTSPLLSYGGLLSSVSNMTLSDDETNKLMEILNQKAGVPHESWKLACQKGDPLSTLKKQLEDKEKLLITEQEAAAAAQIRLRELNKELSAEKSKTLSLEARLRAEQSARVQEAKALWTKIETCEKEHQKHIEQLNQKIGSLQEKLEKGPSAQLVRLQQENSILRDALNQATSQAESRQNAELGRLRQDCVRLGQELTERTNALRADEVHRKKLEAKMATTEQELARVQVEHSSEVDQLRISVQHRDEQVAAMKVELTHLREELHLLTSSQTQRVKLDEAEAADQTEKDESGSETESDQAFESLEKDSQLLRLEEELQQLRDELQQAQDHSRELQETSSTAERHNKQREAELKVALTEAESRFVSLSSDFQAALLGLFPGISVEAEQVGQRNWLQLCTQKVQESKSEAERSQSEVRRLLCVSMEKHESALRIQDVTEHQPAATLQLRLKEAEQKLTELQAEFDHKAKLLQEMEAKLRSLQKCSEEEEKLWNNKLLESEQQKQTIQDQLKLLEDEVHCKRTETENTQQLKEQLMLMEAQLEKQLEEASFTQSCSEELVQLQSQLQQMSVRLQSERHQRQQLDGELQQARQEVSQLQQQLEADLRSAAPPKEETPV